MCALEPCVAAQEFKTAQRVSRSRSQPALRRSVRPKPRTTSRATTFWSCFRVAEVGALKTIYFRVSNCTPSGPSVKSKESPEREEPVSRALVTVPQRSTAAGLSTGRQGRQHCWNLRLAALQLSSLPVPSGKSTAAANTLLHYFSKDFLSRLMSA